MRSGALIDLFAWRAESMTADRFAEQCERAGLACVGQEKISWESGPYLIDALSIFARPGSRWQRPRRGDPQPALRPGGAADGAAVRARSFPGVGGPD